MWHDMKTRDLRMQDTLKHICRWCHHWWANCQCRDICHDSVTLWHDIEITKVQMQFTLQSHLLRDLSNMKFFVLVMEKHLQLGLEQDQDVVLGTTYEVPDWEGGEVLVRLLPVAPHDGLGGRHHMVPHILRRTCNVQILVMTMVMIMIIVFIITWSLTFSGGPAMCSG